MSLESWLSVGSLVAGVVSLVYAVAVSREKRKIERITQEQMVAIAGQVRFAHDSTRFADNHFLQLGELAVNLKKDKSVDAMVLHIQHGARDATAATRQLRGVLSNIDAFQRGMFGVALIRDPSALFRDKPIPYPKTSVHGFPGMESPKEE